MVRGVPSNRPNSVAVRGLLEPFILAKASTGGPISGKGAADTLARVTENRWRPSPGTLYPVLRKMEEAGLLKAELASTPKGTRGRREIEYAITGKGTARLEEERSRLNEDMKRVQRLFVPVMGVIMHEMPEEDALAFADAMEFQHQLRERLLELPVEKRRAAIRRLKPALVEADLLGRLGIEPKQ
jgi:DNA-binding PadR family transcriptional regulator